MEESVVAQCATESDINPGLTAVLRYQADHNYLPHPEEEEEESSSSGSGSDSPAVVGAVRRNTKFDDEEAEDSDVCLHYRLHDTLCQWSVNHDDDDRS